MLGDALEEKQQVFLPFSPDSCALCHLKKIRLIIKTRGTLQGDQQYSDVHASVCASVGVFLMVGLEFRGTHLWPTLSSSALGFFLLGAGEWLCQPFAHACVCVCVCVCARASPSLLAIAPRAWLWQWRSHSVSTAAINARMAPRELLSWPAGPRWVPGSWRECMQRCSWTRRSLMLPVCNDSVHRSFTNKKTWTRPARPLCHGPHTTVAASPQQDHMMRTFLK